MSFWPDLVDAAVLGARRATLPAVPDVAGLPDPASPAGGASPADSAGPPGEAARLLRLAAVASRARRAGYLPARAHELTAPEPAPPDERPEVGVAARSRINELLEADAGELAVEWVRLLARSGRRPPDIVLPALLDSATASKQLRAALVPVLGPLAAWLAAANPAWDWAITAGQAGPLARGTWATAGRRVRRELLEQVRLTDPALGRELVEATWPADPAGDRAAFIAGLAVGLGAGDEPLLDRALADRHGDVRAAAAALLARLPWSAFAGRAARRAAAAVAVEDAGQGPHLVISPPAAAGEEMTADGLDTSAPRGIGLQSWLLQQLAAAPPAAWWARHTGLPPATLLQLATATDWAAPLELGWTGAAIRDRHGPWLSAFLDQPVRQLERLGDGRAISLFQALTEPDRDQWLAAHPDSSLFSAIELVPGPWSARLSAAVRERIAGLARADPDRSPQASRSPRDRRLLRVAALRLEPPDPPQLDPAELHPELADRWADLIHTLSVRAAMRRELAEEPNL